MLGSKAGPLNLALPLPQYVENVLTNFGVARLVDATDSPEMIVGTSAYMSPEQVSWHHVDGRSAF